jgi:hypothetical protein
MKKIEKLQKQLIDAQDLYKIVGIECEQAANKGWYDQLKSAQKRSLSLAAKITKIKNQIRMEQI